MKKATFVIAVYNDTDTLKETLINLLSTISSNDIDIIVVDDANNLPEDQFKIFPSLKIFHNLQRKGVGYSLDFGVRKAETDIVFILGCDIRFFGNWFDRFYNVVKTHPRAIVSTMTSGLNENRRFIAGKENHYYAAHVLFHVTTKNNNRVLPFREYLEAKWNPKMEGEIIQIGCVLGAFYGCHKKWFERIGGFDGHRIWGDLEPLISLRSYINGGRCLLDTKTVTGHIFKKASSNKPVPDLIYNKLLVAYTLLPADMEKEVYDWVKTLTSGNAALQRAKENQQLFDKYRKIKNSISEQELKRRLAPTGVLK